MLAFIFLCGDKTQRKMNVSIFITIKPLSLFFFILLFFASRSECYFIKNALLSSYPDRDTMTNRFFSEDKHYIYC